MNELVKRKDAEANIAELFDAAKIAPRIIADVDGHFILQFSAKGSRPVQEWAQLSGTLEEGDQLL
ncbi:hypothetical protein [Pararhizobium sp. O133]|uniref:hypothetical protein n=1 Tax=Pararhizobium sp. O133 TaxID=3449278 RepID=UPI003F6853C5